VTLATTARHMTRATANQDVGLGTPREERKEEKKKRKKKTHTRKLIIITRTLGNPHSALGVVRVDVIAFAEFGQEQVVNILDADQLGQVADQLARYILDALVDLPRDIVDQAAQDAIEPAYDRG
jgi:hypothetical protein